MSKDKGTDSANHMSDRHARIKAESARLAAEAEAEDAKRNEQQAVRDMKADDEEAAALEKHALIATGETRDQLLERVRKLREDIPSVAVKPLGMSEFAKAQAEIEAKAGREAVAKAERLQAEAKEQRERVAAEIRAREGSMETVHQPNPGMDEQFPAQGATLGKTKK